jgi:CRP-like cAMP-binding protein
VAVVQVAGSAVRLDARALEAATRTSEVLQNALQQYARGVIAATFQGVLCNHFHEVLPRFCRWLLAASDRLQTDRFDVTHETLSNVLGVRRAAVSIAASELQDAEAIHCRYGRIAIVNRRRLERSACECYEVLREDG